MSLKEYNQWIIKSLKNGVFRIALRIFTGIAILIGGLILIDNIFAKITHRTLEETAAGVISMPEFISMIVFAILWLIYGFGYFIMVGSIEALKDMDNDLR